MASKKKKKQTKINYTSLIIAILLVFIIYLNNRILFYRPLLWLLIAFLVVIFLKQFFKISKKNIIIYTIVFFFISIILDGIIVTVFKRIPAFTYNIVSSEKINIYYSPGLRVWQCDKKNYNDLIVDQFYNKGYVCNSEDISTIDSNSFLNSIIENYDEYKNQYVKISGKISKKNSQNYIEMRPYIESEIKVNGYVEFSDSIVLKIFFKNKESILDEYDIYDDILVLGLIKNIEGSSGNYIIYMDDAKVLSEMDLTDYEISVTTESKCNNPTLLISNNINNLYSYCLSEIFVSYSDTTSELVDSLSSNKIEIEDLYSNYKNYETDEEGNILYHLDNYSVLVCNEEKSKDVIIGKTNMKFKNVTCNPRIEQ